MATMNSLSRMWDMMRQRHGIAMRALERLPEAALDSHPIRLMRTPKELVVHWYGMAMKNMTEGALRGSIEELDEQAAVAAIKTKADLIRYAHECWTAADRAFHQLTEEKVNGIVETPWGNTLRGSYCLGAANDESIHHRGQFFAFLRVLGEEPPDMWDFKNNAPEYQPRVRAPQG